MKNKKIRSANVTGVLGSVLILKHLYFGSSDLIIGIEVHLIAAILMFLSAFRNTTLYGEYRKGGGYDWKVKQIQRWLRVLRWVWLTGAVLLLSVGAIESSGHLIFLSAVAILPLLIVVVQIVIDLYKQYRRKNPLPSKFGTTWII